MSEIDKYEVAINAIKDILYMYKVLSDYSGLYDDFGTEDGQFEPSTFIDCNSADYGIDEEDVKLLHEGSAIKLICSVYQAWSQGGYPEIEPASVALAKSLLNEGKLHHIPDLERVLEIALTSINEAQPYFKVVYEKYVIGYLKSLI